MYSIASEMCTLLKPELSSYCLAVLLYLCIKGNIYWNQFVIIVQERGDSRWLHGTSMWV